MRPLYDSAVIQVDITSACHLKCANCTRMVGHHRPNYFMSLNCFARAVESLDGFPGRIGLMGGEPCLHPEFGEILALYRSMVPKEKREFWTSGWKWTEFAEDISETFEPELIHFNDHRQTTGKHQPIAVAISEVVEDESLMWELIDKCPFQLHWSPVITDHGAFFCEIGAALSRAMNGPEGWPVEPGWWNKTPDQFQDQVKALCPNCSGCLPLPKFSDGRGGRDGPTIDVVSRGNLERLKAAGSPKALRGDVEVWDRKLTRADIERMIGGWRPREFRDFVAHSPEEVEKALA
jgi:hypothetical protein